MKRDPDLLRNILLVLESMEPEDGIYELTADKVGAKSYDQLSLHLDLLLDEGLIRPLGRNPTFDEIFLVNGITAKGYDFIESVRDPDVWNFTKNGASKIGSWSVKLAVDLAKKAIEKKANDILGLG